MRKPALVLLFAVASGNVRASDPSVARLWNEACLASIRTDFPAPTVHARNLYHLSAVMWDAWAAYDPAAIGLYHNENATAPDIEAARREAISYAAYFLLRWRYWQTGGGADAFQEANLVRFEQLLTSLGYSTTAVPEFTGSTPLDVGARCAVTFAFEGDVGFDDGSNEIGFFRNPSTYQPVNPPLILANAGTGPLVDPNRWQPLTFEVAMTQNGQQAGTTQDYVGFHWGYVTPFALDGPAAGGVYERFDPGQPPLLGGPGDAAFKAQNVELIAFSRDLDPANGRFIDISPGAIGNNPLGTNAGTGHPLNPATGQPYPPNVVNEADFGRMIAEYWADGPRSETPPGHWNLIANRVADHPDFQRRLFGTGAELTPLEWDLKLYVALNAALHDAAVACWGVKAKYDYVRPITSVRHLGGLGQSSDPGLPAYHPSGLPLVPDLIELVTAETAQPGGRHAGLTPNTIAIYAWKGEPANPQTEVGGAAWIQADRWLPYQRATFVTPAFAGYVSGHSTFSRAAAEVLTHFTGTPFFPGGLAVHVEEPGDLEFEFGPTARTELQWGTYYDAADQAGLSRIYGGIHPNCDDLPGRRLGSKVGLNAIRKIVRFFDGSILNDSSARIAFESGRPVLRWDAIGDYRYQVEASASLESSSFTPVASATARPFGPASFTDPAAPAGRRFYRIRRLDP